MCYSPGEYGIFQCVAVLLCMPFDRDNNRVCFLPVCEVLPFRFSKSDFLKSFVVLTLHVKCLDTRTPWWMAIVT